MVVPKFILSHTMHHALGCNVPLSFVCRNEVQIGLTDKVNITGRLVMLIPPDLETEVYLHRSSVSQFIRLPAGTKPLKETLPSSIQDRRLSFASTSVVAKLLHQNLMTKDEGLTPTAEEDLDEENRLALLYQLNASKHMSELIISFSSDPFGQGMRVLSTRRDRN